MEGSPATGGWDSMQCTPEMERLRQHGAHMPAMREAAPVWCALALDAADADAFYEVALEGEEDQHHRDRRDRGAGHQHAVVGVELTLQCGQSDLDRVLETVAQDDER